MLGEAKASLTLNRKRFLVKFMNKQVLDRL